MSFSRLTCTQYSDNPNKYKLRDIMGPGTSPDRENDKDIEFHSFDANGSYIEPPDAQFLRVHAAFAKVLEFSHAFSYFLRVERQVSNSEDGGLDEGSLDEDSDDEIFGPIYQKDPGLLERGLKFMLNHNT